MDGRMMDGCTHLTRNTESIFAGTHRRLEEGEDKVRVHFVGTSEVKQGVCSNG